MSGIKSFFFSYILRENKLNLLNYVIIYFLAVHCEPIAVSGMHISVRVEGTRLGHTAVFQCPVGFRVNGTANLTCQASGKCNKAWELN